MLVAVGLIALGGGRANAGLGAPKGLHVTASGPGSITLAWTRRPKAREYSLWRGDVRLGVTTATSHTFSGLHCGHTYQLGVRAIYRAGHSATSTKAANTTSFPPSVFVATNGSDSAPCTAAAPCATFGRAYQVARPGQVVEVAGGTYPGQTLDTPRKPDGSRQIIFRAAPGASVTTGEIRTNGINAVRFTGMTMDDYYVATGSSNITFLRDTATEFYIRSSRGISVIGGSIGNVCDATSATVGAAYQSSVPSSKILISGVRFHDMTRSCDPSGHPECLFVQEVDGLTLENSSFTRCDVFDVYVHRIGIPGNATNVVIRGNTFNPATGGGFYSMLLRADAGESLTNYRISRNDFLQDLVVENAGGSTVKNFVFCKNTGSGRLHVQGSTSGVSRTC